MPGTEKLSKLEHDHSQPKRTICVEGIGTATVLPDLCHLLVTITSQKATVAQAKDSVDRRLLYIKQTIHNSRIPETDVRIFHHIQPSFMHTTELYVSSDDLPRLQELREILAQKLDESVTLSPISFSVSSSALVRGRAQSSCSAVQDARKKAAEMVRLVEGSLGSPLSVQQLSCDEVSPTLTVPVSTAENSQFFSWQNASTSFNSKVQIVFEIKPRKT